MIVGMDFGTTNTGAAIFHGGSIRLLPLDPVSSTPNICRTTLYLTRTRDYYLGSEALNLYFQQNIGRPSLLRKIKVGEILQVFAELPAFYRDVFVFDDEFSPGRLFVSIKTALKNPTYYGTVFQNYWYSASDLVAIFLIGMKQRMEKHLGWPVKEIVLGRPVHFSNDPTEDKIAQSRLLEAAFKAGFEKVYLEYEPVAAALSYEQGIKDKQVVLVFDFGGGTLDFTVMEIGGNTGRQVYATGGVPIAGDIFDQRLFRVTIPKHLGENDYFLSGGSRYPIPAYIYDQLSTPQEVLSLNTPQNLEMLQGIHQGAVHKEKTQLLLKVISTNYALLLFDLVERAKRELSEKVETKLAYQTNDFSLEEPITRTRFQQAIRKEYEIIRDELKRTIEQSGLQTKDIDRVIRTGGSSQIPLFVHMLEDVFGWQKVQKIDIFSSVTSGLSVRGWEIATGRTSLEENTPSTFHGVEGLSEKQKSRPEIEEINLDVVSQRLEVSNSLERILSTTQDHLILIAAGNTFRILPVSDLEGPAQDGKEGVDFDEQIDVVNQDAESGSLKAAYVPLDVDIILATNLFKLVMVPTRSLFLAQQAGGQAVNDLLRLDPAERVSALLPWDRKKTENKYLCLITSFGQGRAFDTKLLNDQLSKNPFFQLERRYNGVPVALEPAREGDDLLIGTSIGRVGRARVIDMSILVYEVIKTRPGEQVQAALAFKEGEQVVAVSDGGVFLPVDLASLPIGGALASRAQNIRRNFHITGLVRLPVTSKPEGKYAITSSSRLVRFPIPQLNQISAGAATVKTAILNPGESLLVLIEDLSHPELTRAG